MIALKEKHFPVAEYVLYFLKKKRKILRPLNCMP